ncbi:MAG: TRAP transporter small permease [Spirochaetes bacterium]|nr:TRAP transporter small permease [Spirochaetota bacterium]
MNKIFEIMRKTLYLICISAIALMLFIIFVQVVSRYFFGYTFDWSEELARYLFVWVVFIGSALIIGDKGHMAVKIFPEKLKGTVGGVILEIFIKICSFYFVLLLISQGFKMSTVMMFQTAPALGIPMGFVYSIIPISGFLMFLYILKDTIDFFSKKRFSEKKLK